MKLKLLRKITLLVLASLWTAKFAYATDLTETLVSAYQNNPDLIAARENLKVTDEQMFQAVSNFLPQIDYNLNINQRKTDQSLDNNNFYYDPDSTFFVKTTPWRNIKTKEGTLKLQQNVFNGGADSINIKLAKYSIESARNYLTYMEQNIFLNTIHAYLSVEFYNKLLSIGKSNTEFYERKLEKVKQEVEAGIRKKSDIYEAEAAKANALANLSQSEANLEAAKASFYKLSGIQVEKLEPRSSLFTPLESKEETFSFTQKNNPLIKYHYNQNKAFELSSKAAFSVFLPKANFEASMSKTQIRESYANSAYNSSPYTDDKTVMLKVTIPIYQKGLEYSGVRKSKAQAAASRYTLKNIKDQISQQIIQNWNEYIAGKELVESTALSVKAAQEALDGFSQGYDEGLNSISDLLSANENYFQYQIRHENALIQLELSIYSIAALMGKLTARELKLPTKYYNPEVNYNKVRLELVGF